MVNRAVPAVVTLLTREGTEDEVDNVGPLEVGQSFL